MKRQSDLQIAAEQANRNELRYLAYKMRRATHELKNAKASRELLRKDGVIA